MKKCFSGFKDIIVCLVEEIGKMAYWGNSLIFLLLKHTLNSATSLLPYDRFWFQGQPTLVQPKGVYFFKSCGPHLAFFFFFLSTLTRKSGGFFFPSYCRCWKIYVLGHVTTLRPQCPYLENNSLSLKSPSKSETQYFLWEEKLWRPKNKTKASPCYI